MLNQQKFQSVQIISIYQNQKTGSGAVFLQNNLWWKFSVLMHLIKRHIQYVIIKKSSYSQKGGNVKKDPPGWFPLRETKQQYFLGFTFKTMTSLNSPMYKMVVKHENQKSSLKCSKRIVLFARKKKSQTTPKVSKSYFRLKPDYNRILQPMIQLSFIIASHYLHHTHVMLTMIALDNCTAFHVLSMSVRHAVLDVAVYLWLDVAMVTKATKFFISRCCHALWLLLLTACV